MDIPVAVSDPIPAYRQGLILLLSQAGYLAEAVDIDDIPVWAGGPGRRAALVTLDLPRDSQVLAGLTDANPDLVVVVLLRDAAPKAYQEALRAGATGAIAWNETSEMVVKGLEAAVLDNCCLLPLAVGRELAGATVSSAGRPSVSVVEAEWLRMLANGATIPELAAAASYSEREMYRLLHRLYARMGARNRMEALVKAAQAGLLP